MAPRWLKGLGRVGEAVAGVAAKAGVPYAGLADTIIKAAKDRGGTGQEKADYVLSELVGTGEGAIAALEKEIGHKVPEEAAIAYLQGLVELRYRLLKAAGVV